MTLLQSWGDSLSLLSYQSFKLFVLVSLKSIIDVYKKLLRYWWWLVIPAFFIYNQFDSGPVLFVLAAGFLFTYLFVFAIVCSTRPSIEQKNGEYFKKQLWHFPLAFIYLLPAYFLPKFIALASPIFFLLFYLDSADSYFFKKVGALKAWKRTILMGVYNMPLFIIINFILYISSRLTLSLGATSPLVVVITGLLFLPISVCVYTNLYIKCLHGQFELYFSQPK